MSDLTVDERVAAASSVEVTGAELHRFVRDVSPRVQIAAARSPLLLCVHIDVLLKSGHVMAQVHAVKHPSISEAGIRAALSSPYVGVRLGLMENEVLDDKHLELGLADSDVRVRVAAARHLGASVEFVARVFASSLDDDVRGAAASSPLLDAFLAEAAIGDRSPVVRAGVAGNLSLSQFQLSVLLSDSDERVRAAAAGNGSATPRVLMAVMDDPSTEVRRALVSNFRLTFRQLLRLMRDDDQLVSRSARSELVER